MFATPRSGKMSIDYLKSLPTRPECWRLFRLPYHRHQSLSRSHLFRGHRWVNLADSHLKGDRHAAQTASVTDFERVYWRWTTTPLEQALLQLRGQYVVRTLTVSIVQPKSESLWLFRILYAGFAGLNEFSELSAPSHSPKMLAINICIQDPIEPSLLWTTRPRSIRYLQLK